jgi:hypothetical protein
MIAADREKPLVHFALASSHCFSSTYSIMSDKNPQIRFPLWKFLNQPLFNPYSPLILNPQRFWQRYQLEHLERCWIRAYRPEEHYRS